MSLAASLEEWESFCRLVGAQNLLPVAAAGNPASTSKLSSAHIGKVPSKYLGDGLVVGFKKWQEHRAEVGEVAKWAKSNKYSVSVITGRPWNDTHHIYALDVDIGDPVLQDVVYAILREFIPRLPLFWRGRDNSARRLYVVAVAGLPLNKRVLGFIPDADLRQQAIEFLGLGQQFVAAGTHPSGARYTWYLNDPLLGDEQLPDTIPEVSGETWAAIWAAFKARLPVISDTEDKKSKARRLDGAFKSDEVAEFLDAEGWTMTTGADGERYIRSPRAHLYSTEQGDGDTSVCYFPAGSGGFAQGHFKSLHATDASMSDKDWLDEFGLLGMEFEDLGEDDTEHDAYIPTFTERDKAGRIKPTMSNLVKAAAAPAVVGYTFRFDTFTQQVIMTDATTGQREPLTDALCTQLNVLLQDKWKFADINSTKLDEALTAVAFNNKFDALQDWIASLHWDGQARCATFFSELWDLPKDAYHEAVGLYFWTALAGRALVPGIQADMSPVLISREQGKSKSKALRTLVPDPGWFAAMDFAESRTERVRKMLGKCVLELEEMQGMGRREVGEVRSFLTEMIDTTRPPYGRRAVDLPRRCIFVATTNDPEPFNDQSGNRRWLPMQIDDEFDPVGVVPWIEANRDQLWAEAAVLFNANGVMWQDAQNLGRDETRKYEAVNLSVAAKIQRWMEQPQNEFDTVEENAPVNGDLPHFTTGRIIADIWPDSEGREFALKRDISAALRRLGYRNIRLRVRGQGGDNREYVWSKQEDLK